MRGRSDPITAISQPPRAGRRTLRTAADEHTNSGTTAGLFIGSSQYCRIPFIGMATDRPRASKIFYLT